MQTTLQSCKHDDFDDCNVAVSNRPPTTSFADDCPLGVQSGRTHITSSPSISGSCTQLNLSNDPPRRSTDPGRYADTTRYHHLNVPHDLQELSSEITPDTHAAAPSLASLRRASQARRVPHSPTAMEETLDDETTNQQHSLRQRYFGSFQSPVLPEAMCGQGCHATRGYCEKPGQCSCRFGWQGPKCDQCKPLPGCLHGHCTKPLECICDPGWTGIFCHIPLCSPKCHHEHGYCARPNECRCRVGWMGENCSQCCPYPGCRHGSCNKPWECTCEPGWGGMLCDKPACETCAEGTTCTPDVKCTCPPHQNCTAER